MGTGTLYAGYAPAGSFTVTTAGRSAVRRPAFGWAAQYQVTSGPATLQLSQFPLVPLVVLLEVLAWAALLARAPRTVTAGHEPTARTAMTPAHQSREHRWRMLVLVVLVVAGVGVAAGARGNPVPVSPLVAPAALVSPANAESSAWYCTGQTTSAGGAPGFLLVTNTTGHPVAATVSEETDGGSVENAAVSVPARGDVIPTVPAPASGAWLSAIVTVAGGGVAVSQVVAGTDGVVGVAVPEHDVGLLVLRRRFHRRVRTGSTSRCSTPRRRPSWPTSASPRRAESSIRSTSRGSSCSPTRWWQRTSAPKSRTRPWSARRSRHGPAASWRPRSRSTPATTAGLSLVPGSNAAQSTWFIPQSEETADATSEIDVYNPGQVPESVTVHLRLPSGPLAPLLHTVAPGRTWTLVTSTQTRIPVSTFYSARIEASGGPGVVVSRDVAAPATHQSPQAGIAGAFDGLSASSSSGEWIIPAPGNPTQSPASNVGTREPGPREHLGRDRALQCVRPSRPPRAPSSSRARSHPGATSEVNGTALAPVGLNPVLVHSSGTMAISEDVGPTGMVGVVTMPGIPLSADIGL